MLFADLTDADFGLIHAPIDDLGFRAGSTLFQEGASAVGIFTLCTGMIKLMRSTADGRQRIVRVVAARQRVCHFGLKMRSATDGQVATLFAREDMGSMLNLQLETVSREVSSLVREGALKPLDKQGRAYRILNPNHLLAT